jgi:hypothetical protein
MVICLRMAAPVGPSARGRTAAAPTREDDTMSNGTGSDDEPIRTADAGTPAPGGVLDEHLATKVTRGVVDGFTEASRAFSNELAGSSGFPELVGRSAAGVIRASARLLDEVANVVHDASGGARSPGSTIVVDVENVDYERLATMIAAKIQADGVTAS